MNQDLPGGLRDFRFLQHPHLRGVRLLLEFLRVEHALHERGIDSTIVVFGGTQILERAAAEARLDQARSALAADAGNAAKRRAVEVAERRLAKAHFYDEAREFARLAAAAGRTIVTGGGPGIMEAANRGARDAGAFTIGFNIRLPEEQVPNAYVSEGLCFYFRYFALRKMHFLLRAKALVCFPGGFGTLDELTDALTLRQTGRMQAIPLLLFGREYWERVLDFRFLADEGVIHDEHLELVRYVETAREAWDVLGLDAQSAGG